jgi:hypothetical protein
MTLMGAPGSREIARLVTIIESEAIPTGPAEKTTRRPIP